MKYVLFLLALCISISVQAQKIRFTDTSNKWSLLVTGPDAYSALGAASYSGDTILYGRKYSVSTNGIPFVREDTITNKIYYLSDTGEHVFFDYNLQLNDTFSVVAQYGQDTTDTVHIRHVVQSIDSIQLGNVYHKVWKMNCAGSISWGGCADYTFIEGIGTTSGPSFNIFPLFFEGCTQIRCFSSKGVYPTCAPSVWLPCGGVPLGAFNPMPVSWFDNTTSCNYTQGVDNASLTAAPTLFPNPSDKNVVLRIPVQISKAVLQVMDMSGRVVLQQKVEGGKDFPLHLYLQQPGVYLYTVQNAQNGQRWTGKFVF